MLGSCKSPQQDIHEKLLFLPPAQGHLFLPAKTYHLHSFCLQVLLVCTFGSDECRSKPKGKSNNIIKTLYIDSHDQLSELNNIQDVDHYSKF